jgi:hypothetical protein
MARTAIPKCFYLTEKALASLAWYAIESGHIRTVNGEQQVNLSAAMEEIAHSLREDNRNDTRTVCKNR